MARLTADVWVHAYLRRLQLAHIPAYVIARGDGTAGAVMVKVATLDGCAALWQRSVDPMTGGRSWMILSEGPEPQVDAAIGRQRKVDPDLWVVEVEDRAGRHLLDEPGLKE
ncbi:DUF1491 family protein [Rhodobacteraceae bacterium CCMM004]|nr:DUF1491 family protein [Rhodobacteraceae bacterium CCMM004]